MPWPVYRAIEPVRAGDPAAGETGNRGEMLVEQIHGQPGHAVGVDAEFATAGRDGDGSGTDGARFGAGVERQRAPAVTAKRAACVCR